MTTIATDGKTMAADGYVITATDTIVETEARKITRLKDGRIVGVAGRISDLYTLAKWLNNGMEGERPEFKSEALIIGKDGTFYVNTDLVPVPCTGDFHAIGSGKDHALTAMDIGLFPHEAVKFAMKRDPFTGGMIVVEAL